MKRSVRRGFTLMETVVSVGVIAVMVPIVMAFTVAGGESSRTAANETRSSLLARTVAHEIRLARDGAGQVLDGPLTWPDFPGGGERLVLSADRDGRLLQQLAAETYAQGLRDREVDFLVSVRGEARPVDGVTGDAVLSQVEISVEFPPAAAAENRRKFTYVELMHRDD